MGKQLKLFNGRAHCCVKYSDPLWKGFRVNGEMHAYVAAYSREDARRVIEEYCGRLPSLSEIRDYWNSGNWGNSMNGITPERGLWLAIDGNPPARVV